MSKSIILSLSLSLLVLIHSVKASLDYKSALTKSLLYYEAQRSGELPSNQRAQWRGNSALNDGKDAEIDLVGGYYDAGDNVKFGLPLAFTMTMLSWSAIEFEPELQAQGEWSNVVEAVKWGTDYLIKAHPQPNVLYGQVGDGSSDHSCWQRPEDMTTPRTAFKIDEQNPGADLAGETAAALAAASIVFRQSNPSYSVQLITHAKQLFDFATKHTGVYQSSILSAGQFYSSSGYEDELLWAAAWLAWATNENTYLEFINDHSTNNGGVRSSFSWDDKYIGAQVVITKMLTPGNQHLNEYKMNAEQFICNCIQKGSSNIRRTNGGLLWFNEWNNLQYVTASSFLLSAYERTLNKINGTIQCANGEAKPQDLIDFARTQVDYILGSNPQGLSYMVGFGSNYPKRVHRRGASIVSIKKDSSLVGCQQGFDTWFHRNADNPNVLDGAIVGGPNERDEYRDDRENYQQAEPATVNNAPFVGVLARLSV